MNGVIRCWEGEEIRPGFQSSAGPSGSRKGLEVILIHKKKSGFWWLSQTLDGEGAGGEGGSNPEVFYVDFQGFYVHFQDFLVLIFRIF